MAEITIDLDTLYGGEEPFPQALINAAANQALRAWTAPGPKGEQSEVPTALGREIEKIIRDTIEEEARAAAPKVAEEILAEGVQQYSEYGSPRGERKPVRDIVAAQVVKQLAMSSHGGRTGNRTILEEMIEREVSKVVSAELQTALNEAKAKIVEAVGSEASKALTDALARAIPGLRV